MYTPYSPFYQGFQQNQQYQNVLPQQQVLKAKGKASIDTLRLAPNSSVLVLDETAPIVWLCTSDGVGMVSSQAYDIAPHEDAPPVDMTNIEQRITAIEQILEDMKNGGQSDAPKVRSKQSGKTDASNG